MRNQRYTGRKYGFLSDFWYHAVIWGPSSRLMSLPAMRNLTRLHMMNKDTARQYLAEQIHLRCSYY